MPFGPLYCEFCTKEYWVTPQRRLKNSRFCSRGCRARGINTLEVIAKKIHYGADHPRFLPVGSRRIWGPGVVVKTDRGWEREHRVITQARRGEVVHHRDGNPINNDPNNLVTMTQSAHAREHVRGRDMKGRFVAQQLNSSLVVDIA